LFIDRSRNFLEFPESRVSGDGTFSSSAENILFGDLKLKFVYNFIKDLVVYSRYREEHLLHLRQVFARLGRRASP
jgi:hypothetical protein